MIQLPKDADDREIPLDTKVLYGIGGTARNIVYWVYTVDSDLEKEWGELLARGHGRGQETRRRAHVPHRTRQLGEAGRGLGQMRRRRHRLHVLQQGWNLSKLFSQQYNNWLLSESD